MDTTALQARQQEVAQYEANIVMYKTIAATLPNQWPEHLVQFKGCKDPHAVIATIENLDDVVLVSNLWAHDAAQASIRSEMVELAKSKAILSALEAQSI